MTVKHTENIATNHCDGHIVMENVNIGLQDLWLILTARNRDRDRSRGRDWEQWVLLYCTEMFTMVPRQEWELDQLSPVVPVPFPVPVPVPCSVNKPLDIFTCARLIIGGDLGNRSTFCESILNPSPEVFRSFCLCWNYISTVDVRRNGSFACPWSMNTADLYFGSMQSLFNLEDFALILPNT